MKKTKVFIDIFYYKTALAGIKTYIEELIKGLKDHGSDDIEYIFSHDISKMANNQFFINSKFRLYRWIFQLRYLIWKQVILPYKLFIHKADYVICPDYVGPMFSNSKKIIVVFDDLFWNNKKNYSMVWRKYFKILVKVGINSQTTIVTISKVSRNNLSKIFKNNQIQEIYLSSEEVNLTLSKQHKKKYIIHVGTFEKRKDLITLLKAFRLLKEKESTTLKLLLVGSTHINGDYTVLNQIKSYVKKNNLSNEVLIKGYVDRKTLVKYYSESFLYVFPSINEGFGIPIIEAMNISIPIVCSDIPIFKEICNKSVLYFKKRNENDLYKKMKELIENKELREKLVVSANKNVKRFNRNNFIKQFEKIYN